MSISLEPNKGLRLKLGRLTPIHTWQGGGNFWSHEFQLTVRSGALAGFLPRALEDEDSVLFEYRTGGTEQASTSTGINDMSEIPNRELQALRAAVDELKRKASDPHCDRTKRQMIESFRLPDPQRDRDLYRLIGKGSSAKLIVLWGVEREEGSSLAPGAAVDLMHTPRQEQSFEVPTPTKKGSKLVPVLVLIAALAGGGWLFWQKAQEKQRAADAAKKAEAERIAAFNAAAANITGASTPAPAADLTSTEPPGTVVKDETGAVTGIVGDDGKVAAADPGTILDKDGKAVDKDGKTDAGKPGDVAKDDKGNITGVVDKDGKIAPATAGKTVEAKSGEPVKAAPGTVVRDSKGKVTGVVGKDGKVVNAKPGTTADKDGKVTAGKPGTVYRDHKGAITGIAGKNGAVVNAKPGAFVTPDKPTPKTSTSETTPKASDGKSTHPPGTVVRTPTGQVAGVVGQDGKVVAAKPGTALSKDGKTPAPAPGTILRDRSGAVTGIAGSGGAITPVTPGKVIDDPEGKAVTGTPGTLVRDRTGFVTGVYGPDGRIVTTTTGTVLDKDGKVVTSVPGTVFHDHTGYVTGIAAADGRIADTKPGAFGIDDPAKPDLTGTSASASPATPASVSTPMTTQGPPPAGISALNIVSTSLSPTLGNGTVEVLLNVVARDTSGVVVNAPPINVWKVDGVSQNKPDGKPADGPVLPVSLTPGTHKITTVGNGADGRPFQTDADVVVTPKQ